MRINKCTLWLLVSLIMLCCSEEAMSNGSKEIDLGLSRSQAVFRAIERFREDGYQWQSYRIIVSDETQGIEVVFVPPGATGNDPWVEKPSGLTEVHYYLDAKGRVILRKLLGK